MITPSRIHELLPWYATGTLNETETLEFRDHLSGCEDCREEMATVEELKAELEIHGKAYLDDHPPALSGDRGIRYAAAMPTRREVPYLKGKLPGPKARTGSTLVMRSVFP